MRWRAPSLPALASSLILLLPGGLALNPGALGAQAHYWVNFGVGGSSDEYLGVGASLSHARAPGRILSVRAIYLEEFLPCIFSSCTPGSRFDAGILAGISDGNRWTTFSAAAGLGLASNVPHGSGSARPERSWSPAIPFEAQALFTPFRFVGIGAYGFGNLSVKPLTGLFFTVQVGNLPGK